MNPIEKTIRTALERGDAEDRAYREKVYRSVYAALEKSIAANPDLPEDAILHRRDMLKSSIRTVEQEFVPAFEPEAPTVLAADETVEAPPAHDAFEAAPRAPARDRGARSSWAAASSRYYGDEAEPVETVRPRGNRPVPAHAPTPQYDDDAVPLPEIEPRHSPDADGYEPLDPGFDGLSASREPRSGYRPYDDRDIDDERPKRRRGRFFIIVFLAVTLLASAAMSIWWAMDSGLFLSAEERDTRVPNPPLQLEDEDFQPNGPPPLSDQEAADGRNDDWITVFTPTDPTRVITPPGGAAQVIEIEGGTALRIRSASPDQPVRFEIGEGVLQRIAGRRAVFNIRARTDQGAETQVLVTCDFGPLGDCGRNRLFVSSENRDFVIGRDMPNASPTGAGSIAIASDVGTDGLTVDIIDIRVAMPD
ncbi:hypothetical protein EJC49_07045 [Aquibium carbonis]|uniref:Uncharacterized protein n=1 Tax=Aquibium carbonis TaxID=2495581 RepID=A0A3R9Y9J1_9HYPH|nr:hypothetical protein [Aquibium carbonis]RST87193.1 hypothetical protein EJC49_07045 [Aquibium carbonis]